ncbi:MAG: hypothetical protein JWO96_607 [Candidatus Saccharibacteria bacterium]|nr:hypothetical protein [Candidatus Saccharibacteria bacterium]
MNNSNSSKREVITRRQVRGLMAALAVQFVLGVALTTLISYSPDKHSGVQTTFLVLHIIVAIGILIGVTIRLVLAVRWHSLQIPSAIGLLASLGAFVCGVIATKSGNDVAVFLMAIGFIIAFAAYGYSLGKLTNS